ncbi:PQQ-binding-like beta-propeller repeat protein [Candidatus Poribacteria bacterium]|nr:PQQ-binding-like beta-propeller repeat protein [Candidatus Poribacteria bacterium]
MPPILHTGVKDWHMFMNDLQLSGRSPDENINPPLQQIWKFKTGGPIKASPVVAYGIVYVGSEDGKLYALNANEWEIKWVFNAQSEIRYSAAIWGGRVFFNTRDHRIIALDAITGDKLWEFKSKSWMDSPPVVFDGTVYAGTFPTHIYLLNAITGKITSERKGTVSINGIEYGCSNAEFRPITPQYNANVWRSSTEASKSFPITANGKVYIGSRTGKIHAFDATTKTEIWTHQVGGPVDAAPAISNGLLYFTSLDGSVYAFSNEDNNIDSIDSHGNYGVVARDNAPVYNEQDGSAPMFFLNDGSELPIYNTSEDWYQVQLPNKELAWLDKLSFGEFQETEGILFNKNFCGTPRLLDLIEGAEYPSWSPNGEYVAMLKRKDLSGSYWKAHELWIMDKDGKQLKQLYSGNFYNPYVSWSLDSRLLAFEVDVDSEGYIYTIDWNLGQIRRLVRGAAPVWSPVANQLAFRRREKGYDFVYRINSDGSGGKNIARNKYKTSRYTYTYLHPPTWSPDGDKVAFESVHETRVGNMPVKYAAVDVQNVAGERIRHFGSRHQNARQIGWSSDGNRIAYVLSGSNKTDAVYDKLLYISDVNKEVSKHQILKHTMPAWSPTGNFLAYLEREDCFGLRWKVWIYDLDSGKKYPIARTSMKLASMAWMPDGNHLCIWHTSDYLQGKIYKPANTKGWIVPINLSL